MILPGDFCCVPISGEIGLLISFGEWLNGDGFGDYDHAEIYIGEPDELAPYGYTIGAYPGGAAKIPLICPPEKLPHALWSTGAFDLTDDDRTAIVSNAKKMLKVPYSVLDYIALALHRLHIYVPFLKGYIRSTGHMICSQLVDYVYTVSGVLMFTDNRWPGYVTPAALADLIKERLGDRES